MHILNVSKNVIFHAFFAVKTCFYAFLLASSFQTDITFKRLETEQKKNSHGF